MASRFYRYALRPGAQRFVTACLVGCFLLSTYTIIGSGVGEAKGDSVNGNAVTLATILAFFAVLAGVSQWVARPAAQEAAIKAVEAHEKKGSDAHPALTPRTEHDAVLKALNETNSRLDRLLGRLEND